MNLNTSKGYVMKFLKTKTSLMNNYYLNCPLFCRGYNIKDLEENMDCSLTFNTHVNNCVYAARWIIIRQGVQYQNITALSTLYMS